MLMKSKLHQHVEVKVTEVDEDRKNTTDDGDIISFKFSLCFFIVISSQTRTNNRIFHSDKDC
jgi:hypothetical protein